MASAQVTREDVSRRIWRFSGIAADGRIIGFEFSAPEGATDTTPFKLSGIIGRDSEQCDYFVDDPTVSRVHAELTFSQELGVQIRDLASTNGTFIDGREVTDDYQPLQTGSELQIGEVSLSVSIRK